MRSIPIKVSQNGLWLYLRNKIASGTAKVIILAPEEIEVKPVVITQPTEKIEPGSNKTRYSLEYIAVRLRKLKVKSEPAAINSIKAMFQFNEALNDQNVNKILSELKRTNLIKIDPAGGISFPETI